MDKNATQTFCGNCGTSNNGSFKYCVSCGHELQKASAEITSTLQSNASGVSTTSTEVVCSKCHSNQLSANQKGYNTGAAVVGSLVNGGSGIGLGMAGSEEIRITCLSCGHKFKPGDGSLKKIDDKGNVSYEKQVFVDKAGNRWRNCSLIALVVLILFILFVWSWIKSMIH